MSVYLRNGYLYIEFRYQGVRIKRSVGKKGIVTLTMAKKREAELKRQVALGELDLLENKVPTFSKFIPDYINNIKNIKRLRDTDRTEYCLNLFAKYFGNKKLNKVTPSDISDYINLRLEEGKAPSTVVRELASVRALFNYAKKQRVFKGNNPVSDSDLPCVDNRRERILTHEEEATLLQNCREFMVPILKVLLNTGLRIGELRSLKWIEVDLDKNLLTVTAENSKNKKARIVPLNKLVRKIFLEQKLQGTEYVFDKLNKSKSNINYYFKEACSKSGIRGLTIHDLRHTTASRMLELGSDIVTVGKILGHTNLKSTQRYLHPKQSLFDAVDNLTNFNPTTTNITTTND